MKKIIAFATIAAFSALTVGTASAQSSGPAGQNTTSQGTDTMSKEGMKGGSNMSGGAMKSGTMPATNDASKSGAPAATSAEKGMTSKGTSTQAK